MKQDIINNKDFLKKIFKSTKLESTLNKATDSQLRALLHAINFVVTKKVPVSEKTVGQISKLKKNTQSFSKFEYVFHEKFEQLLNSTSKKIIKTLLSFSPLIKKVLSPYFEKIEWTH